MAVASLPQETWPNVRAVPVPKHRKSTKKLPCALSTPKTPKKTKQSKKTTKKKKIVLTRTIAQKNRKEKKKKRPMDLAQCQDPCFPFPTQCTLNNTSFSQQGTPGPGFCFSPLLCGGRSAQMAPGSIGTSGLLLIPTAVDCLFPALWRSEDPVLGLLTSPSAFSWGAAGP